MDIAVVSLYTKEVKFSPYIPHLRVTKTPLCPTGGGGAVGTDMDRCIIHWCMVSLFLYIDLGLRLNITVAHREFKVILFIACGSLLFITLYSLSLELS